MTRKPHDENAILQGIAVKVIQTSQLPDADHTLIHIEDGHYKFYQLQVAKNQGLFWVKSCYGKIGSSGTLSEVSCGTEEKAKETMQKVYLSKLKKGYVEPLAVELESNQPKTKVKVPKKLTADGKMKLQAFLDSLN